MPSSLRAIHAQDCRTCGKLLKALRLFDCKVQKPFSTQGIHV